MYKKLEANEYKSIEVKIYDKTIQDKNKMRIVALGIEDKYTYAVLENITVYKSCMNPDEALNILLDKFGGKQKRYEVASMDVHSHTKITKKKKELMDWIESLILMNKINQFTG